MDLINITYFDAFHGQIHLVVSSADGGGGSSYSVKINNYFKGQIVKYNVGWISYVHTPILSQDDIDAILDIIIQRDAACNWV